ncbi:MAG: 50S ribosomal protein L10 [Chromatiales bacterium]
MRLDEKQAVVAEVAAVARRAHSAVAAEYAGLTVAQMTALRKNARAVGVYMRVVKNTLARRAFEGTDFACMSDALSGPLILAFSQEEPGSAARVVREFARSNDKLIVRHVAIGGRLLEASAIEEVAKLPTRQEALAMLAGVLKAPVVKFVRILAEPHAKLVRAMAAVRDQKQAA